MFKIIITSVLIILILVFLYMTFFGNKLLVLKDEKQEDFVVNKANVRGMAKKEYYLIPVAILTVILVFGIIF